MYRMDERSIGASIRRLRQERGQTLTALAKAAALTKSTLSKIETGQVSAPISTFLRIADALGVPLAQFFSEPDKAPPFVLTRKGEGKIITRDGSKFGYAYEALALEMRHKRVEPFLLTVRPGEKGVFRHGGQEFIYMLSGKLQFSVGEHRMTLAPGDSLYFNPQFEHTGHVIGAVPAKFLAIFVQDEPPPLRRMREL